MDQLAQVKTKEISLAAGINKQPSPPCVLVVEDSPTQAKLINISLKRMGINVDWLGTLGEALERLKEPNIDVILLDLTLPDSSGLNTFHQVHSFNDAIPIVVLTSLDDHQVAFAYSGDAGHPNR